MAETDQEYWAQVPAQHRAVYEGFISKIKYTVAFGIIAVAFLIFLAL